MSTSRAAIRAAALCIRPCDSYLMRASGTNRNLERVISRISGALLVVVGTVVATSASDARAAGIVGTQTSSLAVGDFDGDGQTDYAYGYPQWSFGEGKVTVVYATEKIEVWNRDSPGMLLTDANDNYFGDSIAAGDFDNDGYDDLAIGVPGDDHEGTNAGSVHIIPGSSLGLSAVFDQVIDQDTAGIANGAEANDYYAEFIATGDFDCDGYDDLAIGIPREDLGAGADAGAVNVIYGSSGGLSTVDDWYHQNINGVAGDAASGENFAGSLLAGNFDGNTSAYGPCDDLVVGVPGESSIQYRGGVIQVFYGGYSTGLQLSNDEYIHQNSLYAEDTVQYYDMFGTVLNAVDYDGNNYDDVVVRVPGDSCGFPAGVPAFQTFAGSGAGLYASWVTDHIGCAYVDTEVQAIVDQYSSCILDPGICHCSEEFAFAVEHDTDIDPDVQQVWMCTEKSQAAAQFCQSVQAQSGPSLSITANDCIEATHEAWQDCLGSEVEAL